MWRDKNSARVGGGVSLRLKMVAAFLCFSIVVLGTLWVFQILLLDDIYRAVKCRNLERCAETVYETVER